ncbi:uncharacterized protein LOC119400015 [Rhipicephalus sanguineus]|uniref:uncharacterized protein LOC119400015 n=1 Tax=Rhipicephalus sanguineus TaxID=34632 RepID=UPI0020C5AFA4|nr:uncharacterized protein LOC119400015 [Rhipicephalus sanguineus]
MGGTAECLFLPDLETSPGRDVSLSRMTSLRHLCLLTWMLVSNSIVVSFVRQIIARAAQLECVHIHCVPPDDRREQRVSWLRGRQREVRFQESPCFACCSTATFIGLVKPVNRDCESVLVE